MLRPLYKLLFKITGWRVEGGFPPELKKFVVVIAPHTSFWDFFVGYCAKEITRLKANFLVKKEVFKFPVGPILISLGGVPVDRNKSQYLVDRIVEIYDQRERFALALTPEGTRRKVQRWKSGFYRIAMKAHIPIILVGFDYGRKLVEIREPFYPSGDMEKEIEEIKSYFRGFEGKHPELGVS